MATCTDPPDARLAAWVCERVHAAGGAIVPRGAHFFRYWDIRRVVYRIIQCLDYAPQTCLYLAAINNRCAATRSCSTVGYNRNPIAATAARNGRTARGAARSGWTLLAYVILDKRAFPPARFKAFAAEITAIKGLDARVEALINFGLAHGLPVRVAPCVLEKGSRWFMPPVQRRLSACAPFVAYARTFSGVRTPRRARQSTPPPPAPPRAAASVG